MTKHSDLTRRMSALRPAVRSAVLRQANRKDTTRVGARAALAAIDRRERKGVTLAEGSAVVSELVAAVLACRKGRRTRWASFRIARAATAEARRDLAIRLAEPLAERLEARSLDGVEDAARRSMRWGGAGGTEWDVQVTEGGELPSYTIAIENNRNVYRGAYDGWAARRDVHRIRVRRDWCLRVGRIGDGSGVSGGRLVLSTRLLVGEPGDRAVYEALTARPGRGYSAVVEPVHLSCWPRGIVTVHRTHKSALDERTPPKLAAILDRERAEERRRLVEAADAAAFAAL